MAIELEGGREVLEDLPFLQLLPEPVRVFVRELFEPAEFGFGDSIVREGEEPDGFYVIVEGRARVVMAAPAGDDEVSLATLHAGDSFGEAALVESTVRRATVRASSDVVVLRLDRRAFEAALQVYPELRTAIAGQVRVQRLHNFMRTETAFAELPLTAVTQMLEACATVQVASGDVVFRQGDDPTAMYIVEDGKLRAFVTDDDAERNVGFLRAGDFFGEVALHSGEVRGATVEATSASSLLKLDRPAFERLMAEHPQFAARIGDQVAAADFERTAHIPLDFAHELLPADASVSQAPDGAGDAFVEPALERAAAFEPEAAERRRVRRFPFIRQLDQMDCAAAALAMACAAFGRRVSISHIRRVAGTGISGTTLRGIQLGGESLGLEVEVVKASPDRAGDLPLPAILHWQGNHWVVLYEAGEASVRIADPAIGKRKLSTDELREHWSGYAALPSPTPRLNDAPAGKLDIGWLLPFVKPLRGRIAIATVLSFVAATAGMLSPLILSSIVDDVLPAKDWAGLAWHAGAMVGLTLFAACVSLLLQRILSGAAQDFDGAALRFLSTRMLTLPLRFFQARRTSDLERRLGGMRDLRRLVVEDVIIAITSVVQLLVAIVILLSFSVSLGLAFVAVTPLFVLLMRLSSVRLRPVYASMEHALDGYAAKQIDVLKGVETIKTSGAEEVTQRRLFRAYDEMRDRVVRGFNSLMTYTTVIGLAGSFMTVGFAIFGAVQVLRGVITIGEFLAFNAIVAMALAPALGLLGIWDEIQSSAIVLQRLADVLEEDPEQSGAGDLLDVPTLEGRVSLEGVSFRHHADGADILADISLDVPPGTMVALVGRSGSGKSTLLRLLAGLLEPTAGTIAFDGVELTKLRYPALRRKIGFVLQQPYLFDATIAENIAFGHDEPNASAVELAAATANATDFIERLPMRYATRVGDAGLQLSGGQTQRVAIARAVYSRPPVLLLDEATSALDAEAERIVKQNLDALLQGRTAFVVAHRLSTVRDADLIVVLDNGRLVEQGTHEELMRREGIYFYLYSQQLGRA